MQESEILMEEGMQEGRTGLDKERRNALEQGESEGSNAR